MGYEISSVVAGVLLIGGIVSALRSFRNPDRPTTKTQLLVVGFACLVQTAGFGFYCAESSAHFFTSAAEACLLSAWSGNVAYFLILLTTRIRALGLLILPALLCFLVLSHVLDSSSAETVPGISAKSTILIFHILAAFLGYSILAMAYGSSILYLTQERLLKRKAFGALFRGLPSLERLDRAAGRGTAAGFVLFGIAIGTGAWMALNLNPPIENWWWEPKILMAELAWVLVGIVFCGRMTGRSSPQGTAKVLLTGSTIILITFFLSHPFRAEVTPPSESSVPPAVQATDTGDQAKENAQ